MKKLIILCLVLFNFIDLQSQTKFGFVLGILPSEKLENAKTFDQTHDWEIITSKPITYFGLGFEKSISKQQSIGIGFKIARQREIIWTEGLTYPSEFETGQYVQDPELKHFEGRIYFNKYYSLNISLKHYLKENLNGVFFGLGTNLFFYSSSDFTLETGFSRPNICSTIIMSVDNALNISSTAILLGSEIGYDVLLAKHFHITASLMPQFKLKPFTKNLDVMNSFVFGLQMKLSYQI